VRGELSFLVGIVELGRKVIDRMVGVLGRCRLVLRSGISVFLDCERGWVG